MGTVRWPCPISALPKGRTEVCPGAAPESSLPREQPGSQGGSGPAGQGSFVMMAEPGCYFSHCNQTSGDASPETESEGPCAWEKRLPGSLSSLAGTEWRCWGPIASSWDPLCAGILIPLMAALPAAAPQSTSTHWAPQCGLSPTAQDGETYPGSYPAGQALSPAEGTLKPCNP